MKAVHRLSLAAIAGIGLSGIAQAVATEAIAAPLRTGGPVCADGVIDNTGGIGAAGPAGAGAAGAGAAGAGGAGAGAPAPAGVIGTTAGEATLADATTVVAPCFPAAGDLTMLAGPAAPMALPGPIPAAPVAPVPVAPLPVVPAGPLIPAAPGAPVPPVPFVAPGPAGAAAASPIAGVLTDAFGMPVDLTAGSK